MRARHMAGTFRLGCLSLLLASLLAGCGGPVKETGANPGTDPRGGTRRKEMEDYMKGQPPGGTRKP